MSANSSIEWTDSTFNPWIGCTKVSPGCDHCYAERDMDIRRHRVKWGAGNPRSRTSDSYWKQPLRWNSREFFECEDCGFRGEGRPWEDFDSVSLGKIDDGFACERCASRSIQSARRRVFCASLADVFDNEAPASWRVDLFNLIRSTPNLDWLLLTKRIGNAAAMIDEAGGWAGVLDTGRARNPLPNVWLGATIVNREEMLRDARKLRQVPASVRFWSVEPMLGDLRQISAELMPGWVIAGGESGPHARPSHPDWFRSLRDQCAAAGVPFLFKQWGEHAPNWLNDEAGNKVPGSEWIDRMGKKAAGRLLDGAEHSAFPATPA